MVTQDIEKKVLERLSLADEVSKYGVIVDNPGDEDFPYKAECSIHRSLDCDLNDADLYERVTVYLSKDKKIFLVNDKFRECVGNAVEFVWVASRAGCCWSKKYKDNYEKVSAEKMALVIALDRHFNVWED